MNQQEVLNANDIEAQTEECCPEFNVEKWDKKTFNWDKKPFIMESMLTFLHMPFMLMISKKMRKMYDLSSRSEANFEDKSDTLVLFHDPSAFKSEIYWAVTKDVEGANNTNITGTFVARVFDGPFNAAPKFINEMNEYLDGENKKAKDYYIHYAYCPICMKKFGHNYQLLFAEV